MICINCFHTKTSVTNSRPHKKTSGIWRRRECPQCSYTFSTYEKPSFEAKTRIHAQNGASAVFSLSKLTLSVAESFTHDKTSREQYSLHLAETIEQLLIREVRQPSTDDIAALTHQVLKRFDELAALQYAAKHGLVASTRRRGRPSIKEV